jgi:LmbE family N-acetylglucosaminyl deacetylase
MSTVIRRLLVLLLVFLLLATLVTALETFRRHRLYWYDVQQDYSYSFSPAGSLTIPVTLERDAVVLPDWDGPWDTALLRMEVESELMGWWFDPCVVIETDAGSDRQCFDRGGKGVRHALLPPGAVQPGAALRLHGEHLTWTVGASEVILFDAPDLTDKRILVLAPHPDDAEIAAFGLYASHESYIVTMTAGNYVDGLYAGLGQDASVQDTLRGEVRTWDALTVPLWGGVTPDKVVSLGYLTYSLKAFHEAASAGSPVPDAISRVPAAYRQGALEDLLGNRQATPEWNSVVADLVAVLDRIQPDVVVSPHPLLDDHTDHQYTTYALLEALDRLSDETTLLLLYNNHHVLAEHNPFGPSDTRITLPPWHDGLQIESLYSHEIPEDMQIRKLFALEAMHDLRMAPLRLTGGPTTVLRDRLEQAYELVRRDPFGDYSYFRRAIRPNELFLLYGPQQRELISRRSEHP